jgi:hypothetical protein
MAWFGDLHDEVAAAQALARMGGFSAAPLPDTGSRPVMPGTLPADTASSQFDFDLFGRRVELHQTEAADLARACGFGFRAAVAALPFGGELRSEG